MNLRHQRFYENCHFCLTELQTLWIQRLQSANKLQCLPGLQGRIGCTKWFKKTQIGRHTPTVPAVSTSPMWTTVRETTLQVPRENRHFEHAEAIEGRENGKVTHRWHHQVLPTLKLQAPKQWKPSYFSRVMNLKPLRINIYMLRKPPPINLTYFPSRGSERNVRICPRVSNSHSSKTLSAFLVSKQKRGVAENMMNWGQSWQQFKLDREMCQKEYAT